MAVWTPAHQIKPALSAVGQLYNTYERERCRRVLNTSVLTGIPLSTASTHASKKKRAEGERGGEQSQVKHSTKNVARFLLEMQDDPLMTKASIFYV